MQCVGCRMQGDAGLAYPCISMHPLCIPQHAFASPLHLPSKRYRYTTPIFCLKYSKSVCEGYQIIMTNIMTISRGAMPPSKFLFPSLKNVSIYVCVNLTLFCSCATISLNDIISYSSSLLQRSFLRRMLQLEPFQGNPCQPREAF